MYWFRKTNTRRRYTSSVWFSLAMLFVFIGSLQSQEPKTDSALAKNVRIEQITGSVSDPTSVVFPEDGSDRMFVLEQEGVIRIYDVSEGEMRENPFMDINERVITGYDMGLLDLAFHPNFKQNGKFYVFYSYQEKGVWRERISEFQASDDRSKGNPESERVVLSVKSHPTCRRGGGLVFGPDDLLYIGLGDGQGEQSVSLDKAMVAQDKSDFKGAILRINPDQKEGEKAYAIPSDNPYAGEPNAKGEIYAMGFRNPWRFAFDSKSGDLYVGDNGQNAMEEVAIVKKGGNYGWPYMEGTLISQNLSREERQGMNISKYDMPLWAYKNKEDGIYAVVGGYVYRGEGIPELKGYYLCADHGRGKIWAIREKKDQEKPEVHLLVDRDIKPTSFGQSPEEEIYIAAKGAIYKLVGR